MDDKVWQEFYCNDCDGYFRVKLNMALNMRVEVVCPNCGRKHPRSLKNGLIFEDHNSSEKNFKEEIHTMKSMYSKESLHSKMKVNARDGLEITSEKDLKRDPFLQELWTEHHGGQ